jgi:HK97 gp10 family phage protein
VARADVNTAALEKALRTNPKVDALYTIGGAIARDAAVDAPKLTGAGAASIDHEVVEDETGAHVKVSWDKAHDYMRFAEFGDSRENARPFLRPAAERPRSL